MTPGSTVATRFLPWKRGAAGRNDGAGAAPLILRPYDALTLLTLMLGLVFVLPARFVFAPLGAAGRPAVLFAAGLSLLWALALLQRPEHGPHHDGVPRRRVQPVRWVVGVYLAAQLATYAVGFDRGLSQAEANSADRWLILNVSLAGLALFAADGLSARAHVDALLRRLTWLAGVVAGIGGLQFVAGIDLTPYLRLPGLSANRQLIGIGERGDGFSRVAGTASHYIEFGVVLAMALPIAIHYAMFARTKGQRQRRWLLVALLGSAVPFAVSRSGVLAAAVALGGLAVVWPWRTRLNALVVGLLALVAYRLVQPGLLGTIRSLFTNAENDPSVQGRTDDYAIVGPMIAERPWLGRGAGTFIPERYILLDNQFLNSLVSSGLLGLAALLILLAGGHWLARAVRLRGADQETRHLAQALAATLLVAMASSATFDSFSFTGFTCMVFLLLGVIGALWRLDRTTPHRPLQAGQPEDRLVAPPLMASRGGS